MTEARPENTRSRRRGRRSRRSEGHSSAQAEAESRGHHEVPDHPLIPTGTPEPITTSRDLDDLVEHVRATGSFAYDTEFIGEETYHPWICLIQIATRERVALVDPIGGLDVTPIWELIAEPDLETIVHAGGQDLEPVVRHLDRPPAAIFDTQIAAGFVGRPYPMGLRQLAEEFVGVHLGKALTFTKWDRRPLSGVHVRYAADDVRYLPAVSEILHRELEAFGHAAWARDECEALSDVGRYRFDADTRLVRLMGNRSLKPKNRAVLRELLTLRDRAAREENVPPRTFLADDVLWRLAKEPVRDVDRLAPVKGLPRPVVRSYGEAVLAATERGLNTPRERIPVASSSKEMPNDRVRIDSSWALVCCACLGRSIDPALVTNRREIARIHFARATGEPDPAGFLAPAWRRELIGEVLEDLVAGKSGLEVAWRDDRLEARITPPR